MTRSLVIGSFLAVLATFTLVDATFGQTSWEQYRQRMNEVRERQYQRYEDWNRRQQGYYQERRRPGDQTDQGGFQIELRDRSIPPGDYRVQLPFGIQAHVSVQGQNPPPGPQSRPAWGGSFYAQVDDLTRRINKDLQDIRYGVRQSNHAHLNERVDETLAAAEQLHRLAQERTQEARLREQYDVFDDAWRHLAHELATHDYLNASWLRQEVTNVGQYENSLSQLLRIGDRPVYDRMRVAALTRQLRDATEHLLDDVQIEARDNPQVELLRRRVDRVRRLAAELEQSVAQGVSYRNVVEEYEDFDRAWRQLLASAQQVPEINPHLRTLGRRVRTIDTELHRELKVNPPVVVDPAHVRNLAQSVARQADHLADDLRYGVTNRDREVVRTAQEFAAVARSLERAVATLDDDEDRAAQAARQHWESLEKEMQSLRGERFEHAREMASALEKDLDRLLNMIAQSR